MPTKYVLMTLLLCLMVIGVPIIYTNAKQLRIVYADTKLAPSASAVNYQQETLSSEHPKYYKDTRTDMCFAVFDRKHATALVPCSKAVDALVTGYW